MLFVCTANICRSPTAEMLARHRFGEDEMVFRSAGFLIPDQACPLELVEVLGDRGIDATGHRSYQLDEASVSSADLLLTMENSHVQKATMLVRDSFPKIVPLREAATVVERHGEPGLAFEEFIDALNEHRDPLQYLGSRWDVVDPFGRRIKAYRACVAEIEDLVSTVVSRLR